MKFGQYISIIGVKLSQKKLKTVKKKKKKKKIIHLPYLPSRSWNAGKGDCGYYRSHLGFSVLKGRGFIEVGGWSREEPGMPLSHFFFFFSRNLAGSIEPRLPPSSVAHTGILDAIACLSQEAGHVHGSLNLLFMFIHRY